MVRIWSPLATLLVCAACVQAWPMRHLSLCQLVAPNAYRCGEIVDNLPQATGLALRVSTPNTGAVTLQVGDGPVLPVQRLAAGEAGLPPRCALVDLSPGDLGPGPIHIFEPAPQAWVWCPTQSACYCPQKREPGSPGAR